MKHLIIKLVWFLLPCIAIATDPVASDWEAKPGGDRVAAFKIWLPGDTEKIEAVITVVPGRNGDSRSSTSDPDWQALALRNHCALMGCKLQGADYWSAGDWSGRFVLQALEAFATQTSHPELAKAQMAMWGLSAGGQFCYSFICWHPERVLALVENRGHFIDWVAGPAARRIPSLWIAGEKDDPAIMQQMADSFTTGRRGGACWAFCIEPGAGHVIGRTKEFGISFFEAVFRCRKPVGGKPPAPWIGDLRTHEISPAPAAEPGLQLNSWLPDEQFAKTWHKFVTGAPFTKDDTADAQPTKVAPSPAKTPEAQTP